MQKIGLFGGTFSPLHIGHTITVTTVQNLLNLDKVIWIPNSVQLLKQQATINVEHRLRWLQQVTAYNPSWIVDEVEISGQGGNHSIETINHCIKNATADNEYFWIMGADCYAEFHKWYSWQEILTKVCLVVVSRDGCSLNNVEVDAFVKANFLNNNIPIRKLNLPLVKKSSTKIHNKLINATSQSAEIDDWLQKQLPKYLNYQEVKSIILS